MIKQKISFSSLKIFIKQIRNKFILFNRQRKGFIDIEIEKKIPRLILNKKYKNTVSWILRITVLIGIMTSVITLPWYFSLILSMFLLLFEQILERVIFLYHTLYIQSIPFDYNSSDWLGMLFGVPLVRGSNFKLGMVFDTEENARKIFKCLESWNQDKTEDVENNINISFIIEDENEYSVYIYPNPNKKIMEKLSKKVSKNNEKNERHQQLIMQVVFCKPFDYNASSYFTLFKERYVTGVIFEFGAYVMSDLTKPVEGTKIIFKRDLKIKKREELNEGVEYDHGRLVREVKFTK